MTKSHEHSETYQRHKVKGAKVKLLINSRNELTSEKRRKTITTGHTDSVVKITQFAYLSKGTSIGGLFT